MEEHSGKYMVEFVVENYMEVDIHDILDQQKMRLQEYFYQGKIFSFTVSQDMKKMWMIVLLDSESELVSVLDSLPLTDFSTYSYQELLLHHTVQYIPESSLN